MCATEQQNHFQHAVILSPCARRINRQPGTTLILAKDSRHILQAVHVLDDILRKMHGHQTKKTSMLRERLLVSNFREARVAEQASQIGATGV